MIMLDDDRGAVRFSEGFPRILYIILLSAIAFEMRGEGLSCSLLRFPSICNQQFPFAHPMNDKDTVPTAEKEKDLASTELQEFACLAYN